MQAIASLHGFERDYLRELARRNHKTPEQMAGILIRRALDNLRTGDRVGWCPGSPAVHHVRIDRRYGPRPKVNHLDKSTWTKQERDAWILTGAMPERAMTATARARTLSPQNRTNVEYNPPNRSRHAQRIRAMMAEKPEPPAVLP